MTDNEYCGIQNCKNGQRCLDIGPEYGCVRGHCEVVILCVDSFIDNVMKDFALLTKAARMAKVSPVNQTVDFNMLVEELKEVSINELDFRIEAETTMEFLRNSEGIN